ncbi:MAG TPA: mechanosensitive ion channel family protein [Pyrinomonadaceae bacterium]|nr:mechanosensitive ion channel family protein [Pyrinomonadaceae bacterium]
MSDAEHWTAVDVYCISPTSAISDKRIDLKPGFARADTDSKNVKERKPGNRTALFFVATAVVILAIYLLFRFDQQLMDLLNSRMAGLSFRPRAVRNTILLILFATLAYLIVRALNVGVFTLVRLRRGFDAPTLVRNMFSIIAFAALFFVIFTQVFPDVNLGALFTTSAIFGVILGLALQDTLGNFFAGISLQADRPFQVGDVITVGGQQHSGVVEEITWRAIKIRTFQNHVVTISNSNAAREPIEVCPRDNLNARLVFFNTLYTDSPAKTIHVVREAVREADNVSQKISPIVRIRNFNDSSVDYEVKYWLEDYAKFNDTDALVRQRIWYAFRRNQLTFAFPTRTLLVERRPLRTSADAAPIVERLSAVDIFAPLSPEETTMLAQAASSHVFAPGELVIRAGDPGSSMFVVHNGKVAVQLNENGRPRTVATLSEGAFFGEMALFTGEPRTANIVALEETEVLEIGHRAMKLVFDANPDLVESLSYIIAERRQGLAATAELGDQDDGGSEGLLSSIKRFFGLA